MDLSSGDRVLDMGCGTRRMVQTPTIQDIEAARQAFEANEPRDLFYRAATELVSLALEGRTSLSVAEALAVLLQTWNKMFYQFKAFEEILGPVGAAKCLHLLAPRFFPLVEIR